jgi:hypothetical protein
MLVRLKAAVAVNMAHALLSGGSLAAVGALQRAVGLVQGSGDDLLKHQLATLQAQLLKVPHFIDDVAVQPDKHAAPPRTSRSCCRSRRSPNPACPACQASVLSVPFGIAALLTGDLKRVTAEAAPCLTSLARPCLLLQVVWL